MKILSFAREGNLLKPIEVELTLLPGLPQIHFLGLPDQVIKESIFRIKSALRAQGFEFPKARQVIVNLRPNYIKKSSRGIEFAVAIGILNLTKQIGVPLRENDYVYGELGLDGSVYEPEDLGKDLFMVNDRARVFTGQCESNTDSRNFGILRIKTLRGLSDPVETMAHKIENKVERDDFAMNKDFSVEQAELLQLAALDRYHLLLAGESGVGKTTLALSISSFLPEPTGAEVAKILFQNPHLRTSEAIWWPQVVPHHTATPRALCGGGMTAEGGEIVRAHLGSLILDEFLEFSPKCQEVLREPMQEGRIRIARGSHFQEYELDFAVIATTNLCHCGRYVPAVKNSCRCTQRDLSQYVSRLSGPIMDRFGIIYLMSAEKKGGVRKISGYEILKKIEGIRNWRRAEGAQRKPLDGRQDKVVLPLSMKSIRRRIMTLKVGRTLADMDFSVLVEPRHIEKALRFTWTPFKALQTWDVTVPATTRKKIKKIGY